MHSATASSDRQDEPRADQAPLGRLRVRLLGLDASAADLTVRGFSNCPSSTREELEGAGRAFIVGFNTGLGTDRPDALAAVCTSLSSRRRGFAYEGAGMAWALLDAAPLPGTTGRVRSLLDGPGHPHRYLVHVGCGWGFARTRRPVRAVWDQLDPLLRWLAFDGWGFHQGYFRPRVAIRAGRRPRRITAATARLFDQGVGRSLWFVEGGDPARLARTIGRLAVDRHADLWSGVGLAAVYAGGRPVDDLVALVRVAGVHRPHLAQGATFAAKARVAAGHRDEATERAVEVLAGCGLTEAAEHTDRALTAVAVDGSVHAYERWRSLTREALPVVGPC